MSGGMFPAYHPSMAHQELNHDAGQGFDQAEWNPLLCYLCHQVDILPQTQVQGKSVISF